MRVSPRRATRAAIAVLAAGGVLGLASTANSTSLEAPANVQVTDESARTLKVSWDPSSSPQVDAYVWVKGPTPGGGDTPIAHSAGTATEKVIDGLVCGSSYEIWVAFTSLGPSLPGPLTIVTGATTPCTKPPPSSPTALDVESVDANKLGFRWASGPADLDGLLLRLTGPGRSEAKVVVPVTSYASPVLVCDELYEFSVEWIDDEGQLSAPATISQRTGACAELGAPPAAPANLRGEEARLDWVAFAWTRPADTSTIWLTRTEFTGGGGRRYREGALAAFSTVGLTCSINYGLTVAWVDTTGRVSDPASAEMATEACPVPPPAPAPEQAVLGEQQKGTAPARRKPVIVLTRRMRVSRFRLGRLRLRCRTTRPRCAGLLKLARTKRKVRRTALPVSFGKKRYRAGTRTIKLHVRVPKKAFRKLRKLRRLTVFATVTARDRAGMTSRKRFRVTLIAPKKPKPRRR